MDSDARLWDLADGAWVRRTAKCLCAYVWAAWQTCSRACSEWPTE